MRHIGWTRYLAGDVEAGERLLKDALAECQRLGYQQGAALVMSDLANGLMERGEHAQAATHLQDRLNLTWDAWGLRHTLEQLAEVAAACGESERAARLFGAAEAYREQIGTTLVQSMQSLYEPYLATARSSLGDAAFAAAWAEGRLLSLEAACMEAAKVMRSPAPTEPPDQRARVNTPGGLTARELDVLRLLVEGRSDREIGEALFIGTRTVGTHVANLFAKLGVNARAEAAAVAVRRGLV